MPTTCDIEFENNPQKVVYAGQLLRGTVRLSLTNEKNVYSFFIQIYGEAYCHWSTGSGERSENYTGREDLLNEITQFVGGSNEVNKSNRDEFSLEPGTYTYNFQCNLPSQLPTSVEGKVGHIRYTTRVVLNIPIWPDKEFKERFTVLRPLDLNTIPALRTPKVNVDRRNFSLGGILCCCASGPMKITSRIPVSGYTPGQTINLEIDVKNKSDQTIDDFNVQLIKRINFFAQKKEAGCCDSTNEKKEKHFVSGKNAHGCNANSDGFVRINLDVPPIPPTDTISSRVVKVSYFLRISATVGLCHSDPILKIPITIGTYPIQDIVPGLHIRILNAPDPESPSLGQPPNYTDDDLPTYEEAMDMIDSIGNDFKPKYPVFKRPFSYSSIN